MRWGSRKTGWACIIVAPLQFEQKWRNTFSAAAKNTRNGLINYFLCLVQSPHIFCTQAFQRSYSRTIQTELCISVGQRSSFLSDEQEAEKVSSCWTLRLNGCKNLRAAKQWQFADLRIQVNDFSAQKQSQLIGFTSTCVKIVLEDKGHGTSYTMFLSHLPLSTVWQIVETMMAWVRAILCINPSQCASLQ